jgi:hypothetical protein
VHFTSLYKDWIAVKNFPRTPIVNLLFQIISGCFNLGKVPVQWNSGIINPIFKQGSDDDRQPVKLPWNNLNLGTLQDSIK